MPVKEGEGVVVCVVVGEADDERVPEPLLLALDVPLPLGEAVPVGLGEAVPLTLALGVPVRVGEGE